MENRDIVYDYRGRRSIHIEVENDKLKTYIHDRGGWIFNTTNIVVALDCLKNHDKNLIEILDMDLEYNKDMVISSLEDDGDLHWIYWLSGGVRYWESGSVSDTIYDMLCDDYEDEDERECVFDRVCNAYNEDTVQEELKSMYEGELIQIVNDSTSWSCLAKKIEELSNKIQENVTFYLVDCLSNLISVA